MAQYMVEIKLPAVLSDDFVELIPRQREIVNELFEEGKILSYTLSLNRGRLWVVVFAEDEVEVENMIELFPLIEYMRYKIHELTFHNMVTMAPSISLN